MDVSVVASTILEKRTQLEPLFVVHGQKGLKVIFELISEANKTSVDIGSMLNIVGRIEDEAVYYDVVLLKDQLGITTFNPDDTRPLIGTFLAASCTKAFGLYSKSELKNVSDKIKGMDSGNLEKPIVQGFLSHVAKAFVISHEERRLVLFREIESYASEIIDFPENFTIYSKLETSLSSLMEIDNRIYEISPLQRIEEEHQNLFELLRSIAVTLHNEGKGFSGASPKYFLALQKKYFPSISESSDQYVEDTAFFKDKYKRKSIMLMVYFFLVIAFCLPNAVSNFKSWYTTDYGENRGVLVVKKITTHQGDILKAGDAIWSINGLTKPSLDEFRDELVKTEAESVGITVNRDGRLKVVDVPVFDTESGGRMVGVSFYETSIQNKLSMAFFAVLVAYFIVLILGYFLPIFGIISQTVVWIFSAAALLLILANTTRILEGILGGHPLWAGFMLLCGAVLAYSTYAGFPIIRKWKSTIFNVKK